MPRKANRGVRVKDVFRVKGLEIPLEAYQRAGVTERVTDYVTNAQIDLASNVWDAMSIVHDIDTQWGNAHLNQ